MGLCVSVNAYMCLCGKQNTRDRKTELGEEKEGRIEGKRKEGGRKGEREKKIKFEVCLPLSFLKVH